MPKSHGSAVFQLVGKRKRPDMLKKKKDWIVIRCSGVILRSPVIVERYGTYMCHVLSWPYWDLISAWCFQDGFKNCISSSRTDGHDVIIATCLLLNKVLSFRISSLWSHLWPLHKLILHACSCQLCCDWFMQRLQSLNPQLHNLLSLTRPSKRETRPQLIWKPVQTKGFFPSTYKNKWINE